MAQKEEIIQSVDSRGEALSGIGDQIWEYAETRFQEYRSSALLADTLENEGFSIQKGLSDMPTAFIASFGEGRPVIGFLGEFDALFGLSQAAGVPEKQPLTAGGNGHGCGHNGLGTAALAAALAVRDFLKAHRLKGTVRFYGCPAEESGSGKAYLARDGYFSDLDAALTWHPGSENQVRTDNCLATLSAYIKFYGTSSHAAGSPHLGRSALDAVELLNVGANYLREHIIPEGRLHYAMIDGGGLSPNVVPAYACVLYQVRAPLLRQAREIYERVERIAQGAALMTDTRVEVIFDRGASNLLLNSALDRLLYEKFSELGPAAVNDADIAFAKEIRGSLSEKEKAATENRLRKKYGAAADALLDRIGQKEILDILLPLGENELVSPGSTDVGDASWNTPTAQLSTACYAKDTPGHSWQIVAQGKSHLFHQAVLQAGKVLALAGVELLENPERLRQAREEFDRKIAREPYDGPIPKGIRPAPVR